MSETTGAEILIGGRIPHHLISELCAAICREAISLEWGDASFQPGSALDLLNNRVENENVLLLRLCDEQASWGRFEQLEAFLQQHDIAFDRFTDGKWEFDPEWVAFRPGNEPVALATNTGWQPVIAATVVVDAMKQLTGAVGDLEQGRVAVALTALRLLVQSLSSEAPRIPPPLESLEIDSTPHPG